MTNRPDSSKPPPPPNRVIRAACLCKAVQLEITPLAVDCDHCHCSMCRRAHAAPIVTWSNMPEAQVEVTVGESLLTHYASSPGATRSFCSICGTQLLFRSTRWAGETHVPTAVLLDPPDKRPSAHVYYDARVDWYECADDLPKLGGVTGSEALDG